MTPLPAVAYLRDRRGRCTFTRCRFVWKDGRADSLASALHCKINPRKEEMRNVRMDDQ